MPSVEGDARAEFGTVHIAAPVACLHACVGRTENTSPPISIRLGVDSHSDCRCTILVRLNPSFDEYLLRTGAELLLYHLEH